MSSKVAPSSSVCCAPELLEIDLRDKVVVVTGTSSALSKKLAFQLVKQHATVVMVGSVREAPATRRPAGEEKGKRASAGGHRLRSPLSTPPALVVEQGGDAMDDAAPSSTPLPGATDAAPSPASLPGVTAMECDMHESESVITVCNKIRKKYPNIHVLCTAYVSNDLDFASCDDCDDYDGQKRSNKGNRKARRQRSSTAGEVGMGHFAVTHLLLGVLVATPGSRIVNLSSATARDVIHFKHCAASPSPPPSSPSRTQDWRTQDDWPGFQVSPSSSKSNDGPIQIDAFDDSPDFEGTPSTAPAWCTDPSWWRRPYQDLDAYGHSTHLQLQHACDLAARCKGSGVAVLSVHPAWERPMTSSAVTAANRKGAAAAAAAAAMVAAASAPEESGRSSSQGQSAWGGVSSLRRLLRSTFRAMVAPVGDSSSLRAVSDPLLSPEEASQLHLRCILSEVQPGEFHFIRAQQPQLQPRPNRVVVVAGGAGAFNNRGPKALFEASLAGRREAWGSADRRMLDSVPVSPKTAATANVALAKWKRKVANSKNNPRPPPKSPNKSPTKGQTSPKANTLRYSHLKK